MVAELPIVRAGKRVDRFANPNTLAVDTIPITQIERVGTQGPSWNREF